MTAHFQPTSRGSVSVRELKRFEPCRCGAQPKFAIHFSATDGNSFTAHACAECKDATVEALRALLPPARKGGRHLKNHADLGYCNGDSSSPVRGSIPNWGVKIAARRSK
jgi:hypothetical protein